MYKKIRLRILKTRVIVFLTLIILCPVHYFVEAGGGSVIMVILWSSV
jgi:hypothetical protein